MSVGVFCCAFDLNRNNQSRIEEFLSMIPDPGKTFGKGVSLFDFTFISVNLYIPNWMNLNPTYPKTKTLMSRYEKIVPVFSSDSQRFSTTSCGLFLGLSYVVLLFLVCFLVSLLDFLTLCTSLTWLDS